MNMYLFGHTLTWWRHQMETFSALLIICAGNSPVAGELPAQRPVTRSCDAFWSAPWINSWVNNHEAGDLGRHRAHYDVIVMILVRFYRLICFSHFELTRQNGISCIFCVSFRYCHMSYVIKHAQEWLLWSLSRIPQRLSVQSRPFCWIVPPQDDASKQTVMLTLRQLVEVVHQTVLANAAECQNRRRASAAGVITK